MKTFFLLMFQLSNILSLIPITKIIIGGDLKSLNRYNLRYDASGIFLKFDFDSEISFLPYEIYKIIISDYVLSDYVPCDEKKIEVNGIEYETFRCDSEGIHLFTNFYLITEKYAIKINSENLFNFMNNDYYFRFLSLRNVENIIIDKNLSDLMKVELNNNDFIIRNESFIYQFEDDDEN